MLFPGANPDLLYLLKSMLQFNPKKRITIDQALNHEFFNSIRNKHFEFVADSVLTKEIEFISENVDNLREKVMKEIQKYIN